MSARLVDTTEAEPWGAAVASLTRAFGPGNDRAHILLAGPPGSGKITAAKVCASLLGLAWFRVDLDIADLGALESSMSLTRHGVVPLRYGAGKSSLVVVTGLETFIGRGAAEAFTVVMRHMHRCVVVVNDASRFNAEKSATIHVSGITWDGMERIARRVPGSSTLSFDDFREIRQVHGRQRGDARRAQIETAQLVLARQLGVDIDIARDAAAHTYFTTARFLKGDRLEQLPSDMLNKKWISSNFPMVLSLEDAASFAATMAETELVDHDLVKDMLHSYGMALGRAMPCPDRLIPPPAPLPDSLRKLTRGEIARAGLSALGGGSCRFPFAHRGEHATMAKAKAKGRAKGKAKAKAKAMAASSSGGASSSSAGGGIAAFFSPQKGVPAMSEAVAAHPVTETSVPLPVKIEGEGHPLLSDDIQQYEGNGDHVNEDNVDATRIAFIVRGAESGARVLIDNIVEQSCAHV